LHGGRRRTESYERLAHSFSRSFSLQGHSPLSLLSLQSPLGTPVPTVAPGHSCSYGRSGHSCSYCRPVDSCPYGRPGHSRPYGHPGHSCSYCRPGHSCPYGRPWALLLLLSPLGTPVRSVTLRISDQRATAGTPVRKTTTHTSRQEACAPATLSRPPHGDSTQNTLYKADSS